MSFNDLLSSSKGPGVIGLIMALLVLIGFGLLATLAFEEDSGGKSLAGIVRQNGLRISNDGERLKSLNAKLATIPNRQIVADKVRTISARNKYLDAQFDAQTENLELAELRLDELEEHFFDYKNQYRAFVRDNAEGTELESLETTNGEIYHEVSIRKVTAVGLEMRHRDGLKRIPFEELPAKLQDYYQFDKDQKADEIQREMAMLRRHNKAVGIAHEHAEKANELRRTAARPWT
ncbi:hypothetical protein [Luteolibacter sp. AS25]|uniref:hypothetical protein n=1 Tax=Luteolibacter sp. AS25 TaxID=3135776 RepID=UPI00398B2BED